MRLLLDSTVITAVVYSSFAASSAMAASATWNGTTDATWATLGNWAGPPVAVPGAGETATFNNSGGSDDVINLGAGVTVSTVLFDTAGAAAYTIGSGAVGSQTLTLGTLAGGVQMTSTVAGNQLVNANLALSSTGTYTGGLTNNSTTNSLTVAGGISTSSAGAKVLTVTGSGNTGISGAITNGTGTVGLIKAGTGTLALSGTNAFAGTTVIQNGKLNITAGTTDAAGGFSNFGSTASTTAVTTISSGATLAWSGSFGGNFGGAASASGVLYNSGNFNITATTANNAGTYLGNSGGSYGYLRNNSGAAATVNARFWVAQGSSAAGASVTGVLDIAGGTVTVNGSNQTNNAQTGARGPFLINADNLTHTNPSYAGVNVANGTLSLGGGQTGLQTYYVNTGGNEYSSINVTGTGKITNNNGSGTTSGWALGFTSNASNTATLTLASGGTMETSFLFSNAALGANTLNFNNGTLRATAADPGGLLIGTGASLESVIHAGGATIDTNGFNTKVTRPMLAPTGNGVSGITLGGTATGYVGAPVVVISGDGKGAAAVANFDPATGTVTSITVTSPGSGYTVAPTVTLVGGNGGATGGGVGTATATATIAPVTGGGLNKTGSGTLTLTATNTYSGATTVSAGTLLLDTAADINGTSGVSVNGTGAKLVQTSFTTPTFPVTVANGTVDGTSTLSSVIFESSAANVLTHGNGGAGVLTIDSLTFQDAATINLNVTSTSPEIAVTNALTTGSVNGAGKVTINASNVSWAPGDYQLISYGGLAGVGFSEFQKGTVTGLSGRQSATLTNPAGFIALTIAGDNPVWTGAGNGVWSTATQSPKNWNLITSVTPTDYINGDIVLFDDTATGSTTVNISPANVSPLTTTFNNAGVADSGKDYEIAGTFGIATGTVTLNGIGPVTLSSPNTYPGGTFLNAGTLKINNASAIGTGALTIAGFGTTLDTAGSAITLTTNNAQSWNSDFTFGGTADLNLGTGAVTLNASRTVTTNGTAALTVGGAIGGGFSLTKAGTGTLVLSGSSSIANLKVTGGLLRVTTGTLNVLENSGNNTQLGGGGNMEVSGGATVSITGTGGWFPIGDTNGQTSTLTVSGGTVSVANNFGTEVGRLGAGVLTITSGSFSTTDTGGIGLIIGDNQTGAAGVGIVNLNGGTMTVNKITSVTANPNQFFLNGGTLRPSATNAAWFGAAATLSTEVRNGGAIIDTNSFNVTLAEGLIHSTVGGDNATDGGLTKNGAGILTLGGTNTYTGSTTVNAGTLAVNPAAQPQNKLVINGGKLDVTGAVLVDTLFFGAVQQAGGTTYGATGSGAAVIDDVHFSGTGTVQVINGSISGYASWAASKGLTAGVNDGPAQDPDFDGIENLLEYVLGGNPIGAGSANTSILPLQSLDATNLTLAFRRSDLSEADVVLKAQYSTDMTTWNDFATIGAVDALPAVDITEDSPTADLDTVVVKIPRSGNEVGGKLFGRLNAVKP